MSDAFEVSQHHKALRHGSKDFVPLQLVAHAVDKDRTGSAEAGCKIPCIRKRCMNSWILDRPY